ncbi:hypothetical protein [Mycobacteroides franklinii]|uniref:Minor tail protein n=1 Tax=Mycobacteroides franklinii TaxID=948102 RepID=A0A4R5P6H3_9MYCO|nr:hypothetical protein [Mycobacteroides franklinii]ORA55168.1 hypothetical protein BST24_26320 [Mycobacteroides franklinii]TDH19014.1 hypothetical protein EJ571_20760 [Mycobacteroides franklinii]
MPRSVDKFPEKRGAGAASLNNPLRSQLDYETALADTAQQAGDKIRGAISGALDDVVDVIYELTGLDLSELKEALEGINLSPGAILATIVELAGKALGFPGVLSISRIANIIQDLINGAGEFLNADSVTGNPYWSWDSVMPGFLSGGSIRATANGTQQVIRSEPFPVFPGQTLELRAASQWTGATATAGSNPVKVGFTPFDPAGNPLPDVIRGSLQPSGDHGWQWVPVQDKWPVPPGVAQVSELLILDSGATAGTFRFSNASAWASNLLDLSLVKDLREMVDAIGGAVNSEVANITARLQAITADGKITASEIQGLIQQAQVSGLVIIQTVLNQIKDVINGLVVTPINGIVQDFKNWFGLNQNKTQALNSSGQMAGSAITGAISEAVTGIGSLKDGIVNAATGQSGSGFDLVAVINGLIGVKQSADQAGAAAAAVAALQAKLQGQQNAAGGGLNYTSVFGGADGAALPVEFTGADLKVRGNNGYAGIAASKPDGTYVVTCNKQYSTDDQSLAVVLGDQGGSTNVPEYHLFHSDSGYTAGACLKIDNGSATIGSYTRSGASITFTPFSGGSWSGTLGQGSLVEVHNVGTTWTLTVGGNTVLSVTSSAVTFGASTRYGGGFVMQRATVNNGWFQGTTTYDSFRVAAITLSDYIEPIYLGSGAVMARTNTAAVTVATGTTVLPNSFYTVVQAATPDIACNLTTGTMTVSLSGWYLAKVSTKSNISATATNSSGQAQPAIFVNSTTTVSKLGLPQQYSRSNSSDGSIDLTIPVLALSDSFVIYLNAGDVVRAGQVIGANATTRQLTGDSAGTATYLSLSLLNRSQI